MKKKSHTNNQIHRAMSWYTTVFSIVIAGLSYWQYWRWTHRRMLELAAKVPGPPALPVLGNASIFMVRPGGVPAEVKASILTLCNFRVPLPNGKRNPYGIVMSLGPTISQPLFSQTIRTMLLKLEILDKIAMLHEVYGQYLRFWLGPDLNICIKNPADIRMLLTSSKVNQKGPLYNLMKPFIGSGILAGGPTWRKHRKIANPSYNKKAVEHFTHVFNAEAKQLAIELTQKDPKMKFDVYTDVVKFTTQSVTQTLMGLSKGDSQNVYRIEEMVAATRDLYDLIFAKMTKWWLQIPLIYWLLGWKNTQNYFVKLINDFAGDIVKKRRKALETSTPDEESMGIVDRYILSGELSEQEIRWDTMTLFTTSQEAAAKVASGVLTFLSHLPEWQDRVYNEIIEVLGPNDPVSSEQLKNLQYLDMVYKETLRCLSIAAMIQRTVEEEISINEGKLTLPAGTSLVIPIHHLHRDPQYWEDPWTIKPERFLPENVKKRDPNAFVPFSLGPMDCLGRVYATALVKTIVVWVLRYNRLEPAGSVQDLNKLHVGISVSIAGGYNVKVQPRRNGIRLNGLA